MSKKYNIAVNALWPKTAIDTAAIRMLGGIVKPENCRTVDILSDAAFYILKRESKSYTGKFIKELLGNNNMRKIA